MKDRVSCSRCGGTGAHDIAPEMQQTLDLVRAGVSSAADIHARMPGNNSASSANNRLEWLRAQGFVARERVDGRSWRYVSRKRGGR